MQLIVAENTDSQARLGYVRVQAQRLLDSAQLFVAPGGAWWTSPELTPSVAS